jgi:hypothetical protein
MPESELISPHNLYPRIAEELEAAVAAVPEGTLAQRFYDVMLSSIRFIVTHEDTLRAMVIAGFAGTLENVDATLASHTRMTAAFNTLVSGSSDGLPPAQIEQMAVLLTNFHLLFMLFVLHDRTGGKTATFHLLAFARDAFTLVRPLWMIPPGAKALARLSKILASALGGPLSS